MLHLVTQWHERHSILLIHCVHVILSAAFLLAHGALQGQDFRGSLIGTISDASGGRIEGAVIQVRALESSLER